MLRVSGRRCVVVGGGPVALRRARALCEAGAAVTVIAPTLVEGFDDLPVTIERRAYRTGDTAGALLAVIATDNRNVNQQAASEARAAGALVNRADAPEAGDFVVPAHRPRGPITVAVSTDGISAAAARALAEQCMAAIDDDWQVLLETAEPMRAAMQREVADDAARRRALRRLTDEQAMATLRAGGVEALRDHLAAVLEQAKAGDDAA